LRALPTARIIRPLAIAVTVLDPKGECEMDTAPPSIFNRRQFNKHCAALGLALTAGAPAMAVDPARTVRLAAVTVPAVGQGA
jgi:hypothetical protein